MGERVFNLPDLGEGLEEAEIVEWKVAEGDAVALNQALVDVNTAKALVEIPSPVAGVVRRLHGAEGDVVKVGEPLVTFEVETADEETPPAEGAPAEAGGTEERPRREAVLVGYGVKQEEGTRRRPRLRPPVAASEARAAETPEGEAPQGRVAASPLVRRLARERGVDLARVRGTGPGGRVTREDLLRAAEEPAPAGSGPAAGSGAAGPQAAARLPAPGTEERIPVRGVRRLIAEKMARAWAEVPHVTDFRTVDATHLEALRRELTEESGVKVSPLPVVIRALAEVCGRHPKLNASLDADAGEIVLKGDCHVGVATDTDRGLMVVVVRDAARKGIVAIAREVADLVAAAREGRATPEQLTGSTITVTNVGTFGSESGTPIINVPEVAILALGAVRPRPVVVDGRVEARPAVTLSLSFDHRVLDGAEVGRAMTDLAGILESPFRLGALPR